MSLKQLEKSWHLCTRSTVNVVTSTVYISLAPYLASALAVCLASGTKQ